MQSTMFASLLLLPSLGAATFYNGGKNGTGQYSIGAYGDINTNNLAPFQYGAAHPNATNSVPFINGTLTWRTNVSEIAVGDAVAGTSNNSATILNARVINTEFDLSWKGNSSIQAVLLSQGLVSPGGCIILIDGLDLAQNVTSKYASSDNGSCDNVLGKKCVADFLASVNSTAEGDQCPGIPNLPASCAGTLGTAKAGLNGLTMNVEDFPSPSPLGSGQGFAHILSSAYNGTGNDTAALHEAESRLQILVLKGLNAMACQKVNSSLSVTTTPTPAAAAISATKTGTASLGVDKVSFGILSLGMIAMVVILGL